MQRTLLLILALVLVLSFSSPAAAQDNLITNPGFESEAYSNYINAPDQSASFNIPGGWTGWLVQGNNPGLPWQNVIPNGFPQIGWPRRSGERAYNIGRGQATFTAAIYQQVSATAGTNYQGSAWIYIENPAGTARVGIDPNGGTNPYDSDIVWSNTGSGPNSNFSELTVSATATGSSVTLILFTTQSQPSDPNNVFWDDARLVPGGSGGSVPGSTPVGGVPVVPTSVPPTSPPVAAFVQPQPPQADGSIVHTVRVGETLSSIAFAYGVTIQQLQDLNGISNPRFIAEGQRLIIQPAPGSEDDDDGGQAVASNPTARPTSSQPTGSTDTTATEEAEPTVEPSPTPVPPTPTDAPPAPVVEVDASDVDPSDTSASVCVLMFDDVNQNRFQEQDEDLLENGTVALSKGSDEIDTLDTESDSEPLCFEDLAAGDYIAAATPPDGYGMTTPNQLRLRLAPGETLYIAFGAAEGVTVAAAPTADAESAGSVDEGALVLNEPEVPPSTTDRLLAISGYIVLGAAGLVMIAGIGLTFFVLRRR